MKDSPQRKTQEELQKELSAEDMRLFYDLIDLLFWGRENDIPS